MLRGLTITLFESSGLHRMIILRKEFRTSPEFQTFFEAVRTFFDNIEEIRLYELTRIAGAKEIPETKSLCLCGDENIKPYLILAFPFR